MKIKEMLAREPVRVYLYSLVSAVVGLLVVLGVLDGSMVLPIMGVASAILAVPMVETLRSRVTPAVPEV